MNFGGRLLTINKLCLFKNLLGWAEQALQFKSFCHSASCVNCVTTLWCSTRSDFDTKASSSDKVGGTYLTAPWVSLNITCAEGNVVSSPCWQTTQAGLSSAFSWASAAVWKWPFTQCKAHRRRKPERQIFFYKRNLCRLFPACHCVHPSIMSPKTAAVRSLTTYHFKIKQLFAGHGDRGNEVHISYLDWK